MDEFTLKKINFVENDSVSIESLKRLGFSSTPINGLRKLNENIYSTFTEFGQDGENEFQLVDINQDRVVKKYSKFPEYQKKLDASSKFMVYNKSVASNPKNGMMASFYLYHPEFKIFNENGELLKHIKFGENSPFDFTKHINENKVIFAEPYAGENFIYVLYISKPKSYVEENYDKYAPKLIVFDWEGNLHKNYQLDAPITSFTIDEASNTFYGISFFEMNKIYSVSLDNPKETPSENANFTTYKSKFYSFDINEGWNFSNNQDHIENPADTLYEDENHFYNLVYLSLPRKKLSGSSAMINIKFIIPDKDSKDTSQSSILIGEKFDNYSRNDTIIGGKKMVHEYFELSDVLPNNQKMFAYSNNFTWKEKNKLIQFTINLDKANYKKYGGGIKRMLTSFTVKENSL